MISLKKSLLLNQAGPESQASQHYFFENDYVAPLWISKKNLWNVSTVLHCEYRALSFWFIFFTKGRHCETCQIDRWPILNLCVLVAQMHLKQYFLNTINKIFTGFIQMIIQSIDVHAVCWSIRLLFVNSSLFVPEIKSGFNTSLIDVNNFVIKTV